MTPEVDGKLLSFKIAGTYNGMVLIGDRETGSWWDHITGECVDGKLAGKRLPVSPLLHSTAASALGSHPNARIAVGRQSVPERIMSVSLDWMRRSLGRFLLPLARSTMGDEDGRLPRWEIGLGVWSDTGSVYYPRDIIKKKGRLLTDEFEGRQLLVYLDPGSNVPAAVFIKGGSARWEEDAIVLSDGKVVRDGALWDNAGNQLFTHRPMQLVSRWFGFALTFPGCRVYREKVRP
ncbi:MAG: DUF3179 domain-containing protein [Deltaproteobacteria bacterium]|nr:DUF3179 domain-containing protein [Candidatus Zymogenaceae bacterium]